MNTLEEAYPFAPPAPFLIIYKAHINYDELWWISLGTAEQTLKHSLTNLCKHASFHSF